MNDPRVCVVGAGSHATRQVYPHLGAAGATLVGVCDLVEEKATEEARRFGGTAYTDVDAMLDAEEPDGVVICVGPEAHAELAPRVMRRGMPVYTEKPPAPDAASAREVMEVSRETGVPCTTGFKKRYAAAYERAREWIDSFDADERTALSIDYASARYDNESPRSEFLLDFCIHAIDLVGYLFGGVDRVAAFTEGGHAYAASLAFADGGVGSLSFSDGRSFAVPTEEVEITMTGGDFMTVSNSSRWRIAADGEPGEWREPPLFTSAGDRGYETGHRKELEVFVDSLPGGRRTRSDIAESYRSMHLYEAIRESAERGEPVSVDG